MKEQNDVNALCLDVFAGVSAIVSHDMKNVLAIINESAGLLDDLACMAEDNSGIPAERVQTVTASIAAQVTRANTIVKNLNRFAHSGDVPIATINLKETLSRVIALTARKAAGKTITMRLKCEETLQLHTQPRILDSLLYQLLLVVYENYPAGDAVIVEVTSDKGGISLNFRPETAPSITIEQFPTNEITHLANALNASCNFDSSRITVSLQNETR